MKKFIIIFILTSITRDLFGHTYPTERAVVAQVGEARVDVMITYREPAGERADLLKTRLDLNRDGVINEAERTIAESVMGVLMLRGLQLEVVGERPGVLEPAFKVQITRDGAVEAAALVSYTLEPLAAQGAGATRTLVVRVLEEPGVVATTVLFQGVDGETTLKGELRPVKLLGGQQAMGSVVRAAPPAPKPAPAAPAKKKKPSR
jgi:hypothetical protein